MNNITKKKQQKFIEELLIKRAHRCSEDFRHGYDRFENECYYEPAKGMPTMMYGEKWPKQFVKDLEQHVLDWFYGQYLSGKRKPEQMYHDYVEDIKSGHIQSIAEAFYDANCIPCKNNLLVTLAEQGIPEAIFISKGGIGDEKRFNSRWSNVYRFSLQNGLALNEDVLMNRVFWAFDTSSTMFQMLQVLDKWFLGAEINTDELEILDYRKWVSGRYWG